MDFQDLIRLSGDSEILDYNYDKGVLMIYVALQEIDGKVKIRVKTDTIFFNTLILESRELVFRTCSVKLEELALVLPSQNGFYVPSHSFGGLMQEAKSGYNLAYGRKIVESKYLLSMVGYGRLISCLVSDLNQIEFELENQ